MLVLFADYPNDHVYTYLLVGEWEGEEENNSPLKVGGGSTVP